MNNLRQSLADYLATRRALGFDLAKAGAVLEQFVCFVEQEGASHITTKLALAWARLPENAQPGWWATRLSMVRCFAQYRRAEDPRTEIPPRGLLPHSYRRKPPYIYTDQEIDKLLKAASQLPSPNGLQAATYTVFLGLLAVTGMRMSEAINLDRNDVDLTEGLLIVRRTKFGKSRYVPIHCSTQRKLDEYRQYRDCIYPRPRTDSFFLSKQGRRLSPTTVRQTFAKLSRRIGLRGPSDTHGPRLHDLRHRFAVQTLLGWYRAGINVEPQLPRLATYLGHTHVNHTYWYITAVPELLKWATVRLENSQRQLVLP